MRMRMTLPLRTRPRLLPRLLIALLTLAAVVPGSYAAEPLLDLTKFRGSVVVVDFWASWCAPCRRSFPWLNEMQARYRDQGLVIIGVNVDAERADADKFLAAVPAGFRIVYDPTGKLPEQFGVTAMPSSFVFDRKGELVSRHLGFQNARRGEYEAVLRQLLAVDPSPAIASATDSTSLKTPGTQK